VTDPDDTAEPTVAEPSAGTDVTTDGSWQLAIDLIGIWRRAGEGADDAVAQKLADAAAEGGPAAVERAAIGLTALGNMFLELYADCAGSSIDAVLWDAAAVAEDTTRPSVLRLLPGGAAIREAVLVLSRPGQPGN
jgi:hypothetical protein